MKICLLHCKYISFHEKETSFMYLSVTLKIAFSNFSHWERSFSASLALHSLHLLSCTKHRISVLRRSKPVILCIEALTWLALQKSSLATFSHWERSFSSLALHSLHLLSCTKHIISVLRSSKLVILCIEALKWLALQKSSNTWKSVFCIANNISFHEKETSFIYLSFNLKIEFSTFLSLRKKLFSILGLAFSSFA